MPHFIDTVSLTTMLNWKKWSYRKHVLVAVPLYGIRVSLLPEQTEYSNGRVIWADAGVMVVDTKPTRR